MPREYIDGVDGCANDRFQEWRRNYGRGYILSCREAAEAMLHRADCVCLGRVDTGRQSGRSLTRNRKVCATDRKELSEWAAGHAMRVQSCRNCKPDEERSALTYLRVHIRRSLANLRNRFLPRTSTRWQREARRERLFQFSFTILWIAAAVCLVVFGHFSIAAALWLGLFSVVVILALCGFAFIAFSLGMFFFAYFGYWWIGCSDEDLKEGVCYMMSWWPVTKSPERREFLDLIENERWSVILERWEPLLDAMKRDLGSHPEPSYGEFAVNMWNLINRLAKRARRRQTIRKGEISRSKVASPSSLPPH